MTMRRTSFFDVATLAEDRAPPPGGEGMEGAGVAAEALNHAGASPGFFSGVQSDAATPAPLPLPARGREGLNAVLLALALAFLPAPAFAETVLEAARRDDGAAAMALLEQGGDVAAREADGTTALHWAVYHGDAELARALLAAGADPAARNDYGALPLQLAAENGDPALIGALLEAGVDPESPNDEGQTALMAVARTGRVEPARLLIDAGADVNAAERWGGQTALMWASAQGQTEVMALLIEKGADVNARATVRDWERHVTAEPRIKELASAGLTPLLYAAREGCVDCARILVEAGADIDLADPDGVTPLIMALLNAHFDAAAYLIEAGANPNRWDWYGRTALYAAADLHIPPQGGRREFPSLDQHSGLDVARMLLERGADPNLRLKLIPPERAMVADRVLDDHVINVGTTALIRAAYGADVEMVRLLLEHGADATVRSSHGVSAVFAAAATGGTRGRTKSEADIIASLEMLIPAGADVNWVDRLGRSPLHMAVRMNWLEVAAYLVEHGADVNAVDAAGRIPMGYATGEADWIAFGVTDVVGLLPDMVTLLEELGSPPPRTPPGEAAPPRPTP
jgi:ankyrin repeat protein